ncbi:MAG: hypothetical protein AB1746_03465 [Candidatus Zixiibacteriota bacterium]
MMKNNEDQNIKEPLKKRLLKFGIGFAAILAFYLIIAAGATPPGICGEVLRHNRANNIDASPLFYSEVENIRELQAAVQAMREKIDKK